MEYSYSLSGDALEIFISARARERAFLFRQFGELKANPFLIPAHLLEGDAGRQWNVNQYGNWVIVWWADHAVKEVRIIELRKI